MSQNSCGRWILLTFIARTKSGAMSLGSKPAMPHPMRVTRNTWSRCFRAYLIVKDHPNKQIQNMETKANNKRVVNLIIMDESGSMSLIYDQALMGLNETLDTVKRMQKQDKTIKQSVTLLTFNSTHTHYVFDNTPANHTFTIHNNHYQPAGCTPLYDAIGRGISKVNAQTSADDTVLVTIITDGEENSSREFDLQMVKRLIEKMKKQNWIFAFIGTDNLDVKGMAQQLSIDNDLTFSEDAEGTRQMFEKECAARVRLNKRLSEGEMISPNDYFSL